MARTKGAQWRIPPGFEAAFVEFQTIPNVGKAMAEDLVRLKVRGIRDLARKDPLTMYRNISRLDGTQHDPCVLDCFLAAVEFAQTGSCEVWWNYTARRKGMLAAETAIKVPASRGGKRTARKKAGHGKPRAA